METVYELSGSGFQSSCGHLIMILIIIIFIMIRVIFTIVIIIFIIVTANMISSF